MSGIGWHVFGNPRTTKGRRITKTCRVRVLRVASCPAWSEDLANAPTILAQAALRGLESLVRPKERLSHARVKGGDCTFVSGSGR